MLDNRVVQSLPISSLYFILLIFPCVVPTEQTGFNTRKTDAYSRGGGNTPGNYWWGCAFRYSRSWPYFRPKYVIFHTRFQPLRNYLFITYSDPDLESEQQQKYFLKSISNSHISLSFLLIWNVARKSYWESLVCRLSVIYFRHLKSFVCRVKRTLDVTPCLAHIALVMQAITDL